MTRRVRDEALLALLIYAGLRAQEVCDVQLRDVDLAGGTVTVRGGKAGRSRRVPLPVDARRPLRRYLVDVRCPAGAPCDGDVAERAPLFARIDMTSAGQPIRPGITQRMAQRVVERLGQRAAAGLRAEVAGEACLVLQRRFSDILLNRGVS